MQPVRVYLGARQAMFDSLLRDLLRGAPDISLVSDDPQGHEPEYDVLIVNGIDAARGLLGSSVRPPASGIVLFGRSGGKASIFRRIGSDLQLEQPVEQGLAEAIRLAAARS